MDLRKGLILGGESLWNMVRELVAKAEGPKKSAGDDEPTRKRLRVPSNRWSTKQQTAEWPFGYACAWAGGERMTTVAADYGCRDGSGVHRVIKRLEEKAKSDRALSRRLKALAKKTSSIKS